MARVESEALSRPFQRARARERAGQQVRVCEAAGCTAEAHYRAPQSRDRLGQYYWFCLDHVREYNRAWNYFAGMSEEEVERERQRDATWHRPSWRFGSIGQGGHRHGTQGFRDDFGFFSDEKDEEAEARRQWEQRRRQRRGTPGPSPEAAALAELELEPPTTFQAIKARYKELVKRLHPDANGGDRSQEERLKLVNQAYATLRQAYAAYTR